MRESMRAAWMAKVAVPMLLATAIVTAQGTPVTQGSTQSSGPATTTRTQQPVFTKTVNYYASDLRVRDAKGRFVPGLSKDDFEVYEDGLPQKVEVFYPVVGGRP